MFIVLGGEGSSAEFSLEIVELWSLGGRPCPNIFHVEGKPTTWKVLSLGMFSLM